jgi:hypothetical protein
MAFTEDSRDSEIWKGIPGWEGLYQASSHGRIRGVARTKQHKSKKGLWFDQPRKERVLSPGYTEKGYQVVCLNDSRNGRRKTFRVHRLVCLTFHGASDGVRTEVAHNNGIRDDNRAINLRWATHIENMADIAIHRAALG